MDADTEQRLLQRVLADPERDEPRLAYAEALPGGDPRAELIRIQIQLATLVKAHGGREYGPLLNRRDQLLRLHAATWEQDIPSWVRQHAFLRGFVDRVGVEPATFCRRASELFSSFPILHLVLHGAAGRVEELTRCPQLSQVVSLEFWRNGIGDEGVEALVQSPHLGRLRWLDLRHNQITMKGLEVLCAATNMPQLRWVGLARNEFQDPTDQPASVEDGWILEFESPPIAATLETRFGEKPWLHYQSPNPRFFPPDREEFVGVHG